MRTASLDQSSPTASPKLTVVVSGDTFTSEGAGGNERIIKVTTDEQPWGSQYIIELDNADETLDAKDYEGKEVTLTETFIGETADSFPPLWVDTQQHLSQEGKLRLRLNCVDKWAFIAAHRVTLANASFNQEWQQSDVLDTKVMADGETLLSEGAPALYAALVANGNRTIMGILDAVESDLGVSITMDDEDSYVDTLKPIVSANSGRNLLMQLMDYTESYLKYKTNGNLGVYWPANHATVYSFDTANLFYSCVEEAGVSIPNIIVFWSYKEDGTEWIHSDYDPSGHGVDSDSRTKLGKDIFRHVLVATMEIDNMRTEAELNGYADGAIEKVKAERNQGFLVAPMHVSLELFDKISVTDSRYGTPRVTTGYVHRMVREYDRGIYRITAYLGGVSGGYTVPGGGEGKGLADSDPPTAPAPDADAGITIGAYIADVAFTSIDWNTVSWGAGLVTLADGRSQSVLSGSYDFTVAGAHYFYVILGNSTMQVSTTATNAVDDDRMLVAVGSRGSSSAVKAYILNPYTDDILINTDKVMDGLVTELKLASEAVTTAKIKVGNITAACIATSAITETKISSSAVSTPKLEAGAVTTAKLDALAVTAAKIDALAVTAVKIAANAVTADKINAGAVTAIKIDVATLSAISANCGTLTAGTINGVIAYFGGGNIVCDSGGITIKGEYLKFKLSTTVRGKMYVGASHLIIQALSGWGVALNGDDITVNADFVNMKSCDYMYLAERTSAPSSPSNGMVVYNPTTSNINIYDGSNWWHCNRDSGWA